MAILNRKPRGWARTAAAGGLAIFMCGLAMSVTGSEARSGPARISAGAVSTPAPTSEACGPAGAEVLARTDGLAAQAIYGGELHGKETREDTRQVEEYGPLLTAVA